MPAIRISAKVTPEFHQVDVALYERALTAVEEHARTTSCSPVATRADWAYRKQSIDR
jgi:hypothetical protein